MKPRQQQLPLGIVGVRWESPRDNTRPEVRWIVTEDDEWVGPTDADLAYIERRALAIVDEIYHPLLCTTDSVNAHRRT